MTLKTKLECLGLLVHEWNLPPSPMLQVTTPYGVEAGATVYISPDATLPEAMMKLRAKRLEFENKNQTMAGVFNGWRDIFGT